MMVKKERKRRIKQVLSDLLEYELENPFPKKVLERWKERLKYELEYPFPKKVLERWKERIKIFRVLYISCLPCPCSSLMKCPRYKYFVCSSCKGYMLYSILSAIICNPD